MLSYLKKDFVFSIKWIGIVLIYSLVAGYLFVSEKSDSMFFVEFLLPFIATYLPLGKLLNTEDSKDTRDFLKRMPNKGNSRVVARILYVVLLLVVSFAIKIGFKGLLIEGYDFTSVAAWEKEFSFFFIFFAYFLLELIVFYKYSHYMAQNLGIFAFAIAFIVSLITGKMNVNIHLPSFNLVGIVVVGVIISALLIFGVIKTEKSC